MIRRRRLDLAQVASRSEPAAAAEPADRRESAKLRSLRVPGPGTIASRESGAVRTTEPALRCPRAVTSPTPAAWGRGRETAWPSWRGPEWRSITASGARLQGARRAAGASARAARLTRTLAFSSWKSSWRFRSPCRTASGASSKAWAPGPGPARSDENSSVNTTENPRGVLRRWVGARSSPPAYGPCNEASRQEAPSCNAASGSRAGSWRPVQGHHRTSQDPGPSLRRPFVSSKTRRHLSSPRRRTLLTARGPPRRWSPQRTLGRALDYSSQSTTWRVISAASSRPSPPFGASPAGTVMSVSRT